MASLSGVQENLEEVRSSIEKLSPVTCHLSPVTCHLSPQQEFFSKSYLQALYYPQIILTQFS